MKLAAVNKPGSVIYALLVLPVLWLLVMFIWPLPKSLQPSFSKIVRYSDGSVMRAYISEDEKWRIYLPIEKIDPLYLKTTISYEDKWFYQHFGVNPFSLIRAFNSNIKAGKVVSGGSTISMQLARLSEPKARTLLSKMVEVLRAVQFELRLSKKRILENYVNLAPFGGNVEGIGAASLGYYGRLPEKMTPEEISFLVSLPQAPTLRRPKHKISPINGRNRVLKTMFKRGLIEREAYERGLNAAIPTRFRPFPCQAPHISDYLMLNYPSDVDIHSTIDRDIQLRAENILASYSKGIKDAGASNASVVVIENGSRKLRAAVGSLEYFDEQNQGQVRGFAAYRSPGSTLKPFLYIMALERGIINPEMLLEDAPYTFGEFSPINFSGNWSGLVRAEDALSQSLNMPFVLMLRRSGYSRFVKKMRGIGLSGPLDYRSYGLPIITGGMDVKLLDLANAYVSLAQGGLQGCLITWEDAVAESEKRTFRPGAVWLTLEALGKRNRPDAPNIARYTIPKGRIYWKTGTSYGRRDAWSIGFQQDYTVGVWAGNFSGEGADGIVGALVSAPIMFDILQAVGKKPTNEFPWEHEAKAEIDIIPVCSYSGYKPGPYCRHTKLVKSLKDAAPYLECPFHQNFILEKKTGYRASPWKDYKKGELRDCIILIYPPQVQQVLPGKGKEPQFAPRERISHSRKSLELVSPTDGALFLMPFGVRNAGSIPLQAFTSAKGGKIHWFVNDIYIGDTESGEIMEFEPNGQHLRIAAQDDMGSYKAVEVDVQTED